MSESDSTPRGNSALWPEAKHSPLQPGSQRARGSRWVVLSLCLACFCPVLGGCDPGEDGARLIAACFSDENWDGQAQAGETILLTFSAPVQLVEDAVPAGIRLHPAESNLLGSYHVEAGPRKTQLRIVLGVGSNEFTARGTFGEGEATGVSIDFDRVPIRDERNRRLRAASAVVDLALSIPPPSQLVSTAWIDVDQDRAVTAGDEVELRFDRPVRLSDSVKRNGFQVPDDLLRLPVRSDRLDDGELLSELRENLDPNTIRIVLGSRPRLTVQGNFDPRLVNKPEAPSGLAVQGTRIRPHPGIQDRFGLGVSSRDSMDIDLFEPCDPFVELTPFRGDSLQLDLHTLTALPDGRALLVGGQLSSNPSDGLPSSECWLYQGDGSWAGPFPLTHARFGHTATYFPGFDGEAGTRDDYVLIVGGYDGYKALRGIEVVFPNAPGGVAAFPVYGGYELHLSPRFFHTSHASSNSSAVLAGGLLSKQDFNLRVEEIDLQVEWPDSAEDPRITATTQKLGVLQHARVNHDTCLMRFEGEDFLFAFGGWGAPNSGEQDRVSAAAGFSFSGEQIPIDRPELFSLHDGRSVELRSDPAPPSPRLRHKIVPIAPDGTEWLLVGGTETRDAHRFTIDFDTSPPTVKWVSAGSLVVERHSVGTITLRNGGVLVIGGVEGGAVTDRVELFDPTQNDFAPLCANLISARQGARIAPVGDDRWIIVGGNESDGVMVEEFSP